MNLKSKPISNLDLKFLDVKFIAIDNNQTYLTEALQSVRRTKISQLPSLLKPKNKNYNDKFEESIIDDNSTLFTSDLKNKSGSQSIYNFDQSILSTKFRTSQFQSMDQTLRKNSSIISNFGKQHYEDTRLKEIQKLKEEIKIKKQDQKNFKNKSMPYLRSIQRKQSKQQNSQQEELEKYRRKIALIKKQNELIHKQISSLYRNKINQNKQPLKKVRKIEPFIKDEADNKNKKMRMQIYNLKDTKMLLSPKQNKDINLKNTLDVQKLMKQSSIGQGQMTKSPKGSSKSKLSATIVQKLNFYQNLSDQTPYKQEMENIHKKIISNNLHKNFSQYLLSVNKRIPQFIKKLRN